MSFPRVVVTVGMLAGWLASPSLASAHIDLIAPPPRVPGFPDTTLARGPCGQRENERRPEKVSVFRPGETIDVVWDVYVQHFSYFRIAFDAEGDDSFSARSSLPSDPATDDPTALSAGEGETILAYLEDRSGSIDHVEQRVTLPRVACDHCTLQLIQFTYGLPLRDATYHQCADLVLEGLPVAENEAPPGGASDAALDPDGESGCSLDAPEGQSPRSTVIALAALLAVAGRRRAARTSSAGISAPRASAPRASAPRASAPRASAPRNIDPSGSAPRPIGAPRDDRSSG